MSAIPSPPISNQMILASAGSGKTWRLTNRFIRLICLGVKPEKIIALTFTRKAAAEFLDEILRKLSLACNDEEFAQHLREDIEIPNFDSDFATETLRHLLESLHLLSLGTLDAFFMRILSCFPGEFGLTAGLSILEPHETEAARREVFEDMFEDRGLEDRFLKAFRQATWGSEERYLYRNLDQFVSKYHRTFLEAPDRNRWGQEHAIWPNGCRWLRGIGDIEHEVAGLQRELEDVKLDKAALKTLNTFYTNARNMELGSSFNANTLSKRLFDAYGQLCQGECDPIKVNRSELVLTQKACAHLSHILEHVMFCVLHPHLEQTRGVYQLMEAYEERYHDLIRRGGRLGFDDMQLMLSGDLRTAGAAQIMSQFREEGRLRIDYRLDGTYEHWMLDEFQDTSLVQWRVIENLIDEVVQDPSRRRSLFYVGDVKQAIFGWRGGDSRLFEDIRDHYQSLESGLIEAETMEISWRSGPRVLEAVNRIFGSLSLLEDLFLKYPNFVQRWSDVWKNHQTKHPDRRDHFKLTVIPHRKKDEERKSSEELRFAAVLKTLEEIRPDLHRTTCAVLVRRNSTAGNLADYIRANSASRIPVMVEGESQVGLDHPLATSFLAFLKLAAHPGDRLAWEHLCMTPALSHLDLEAQRKLQSSLVRETLETVFDDGFHGAFEVWLRKLTDGGFEPDDFARRRIELLRQVTREFDQSGNRSIEDFSQFAESYTSRESTSEGVVQIMTIHKAKGLGFDAVIVAEIEESRDEALTAVGSLDLVANRSGAGMRREIEWVLSMPKKEICKLDSTLGAARQKLENERGFEEMCVLYVAMTRAKYACHVICSAPGVQASARRLVVDSLTCDVPEDAVPEVWWVDDVPLQVRYEAGDPRWFEQPQFQTEDLQTAPPDVTALSKQRRFVPVRRAIPSDLADDAVTPAPGRRFMFTPDSIRAAEYGTIVHELFEALHWLDGESPEAVEARVLSEVPEGDDLSQSAADEVLRSLEYTDIRRLFDAASFPGEVELWLEKRFEIIHEGAWISGTFDRVVLVRDPAGQITEIGVFDYKTNKVKNDYQIREACDHYRPQLGIYSAALQRMTGCPAESIRCYLIFTHARRVHEVDLEEGPEG